MPLRYRVSCVAFPRQLFFNAASQSNIALYSIIFPNNSFFRRAMRKHATKCSFDFGRANSLRQISALACIPRTHMHVMLGPALGHGALIGEDDMSA